MISSQVVRLEAGQYQALASQLRTDFGDIDGETLADTLEGLSDLPNLLCSIVRSSLEDEALIVALKGRLGDMKARLERLEARQQRKRELVCGAMSQAGMEKLGAEDFSVSLRQGHPRLEVVDESKIPERYFISQAPKLDRSGLIAALKGGESLDGAALVEGVPYIQVRTK
jgi:hypothetical protein